MTYPVIFTTLIDPIIGKEGQYSNDPNDSGGETCWGITAFEARAFGYAGEMRDMPRDEAVRIYFERYYTQPMLDQLAQIDERIAGKLLDIGVNCGSDTAGIFLQRALNVLSEEGHLYPHVATDGVCGSITRAALRGFIAARGDGGRKVLLGMVIALQSVRYVEIAEKKPTQETFEYGWQLNRAVGAAFAGAMT